MIAAKGTAMHAAPSAGAHRPVLPGRSRRGCRRRGGALVLSEARALAHLLDDAARHDAVLQAPLLVHLAPLLQRARKVHLPLRVRAVVPARELHVLQMRLRLRGCAGEQHSRPPPCAGEKRGRTGASRCSGYSGRGGNCCIQSLQHSACDSCSTSAAMRLMTRRDSASSSVSRVRSANHAPASTALRTNDSGMAARGRSVVASKVSSPTCESNVVSAAASTPRKPQHVRYVSLLLALLVAGL